MKKSNERGSIGGLIYVLAMVCIVAAVGAGAIYDNPGYQFKKSFGFSVPDDPGEVAVLQPFVDKKFAELGKAVEYPMTPEAAQNALEAKRRFMKACDVAVFYKLKTPGSCWAKPAPKQ